MKVLIIEAKLAEWVARTGVDVVDYADADLQSPFQVSYTMQMGSEDWLLMLNQGTFSCYIPLSCVMLIGEQRL